LNLETTVHAVFTRAEEVGWLGAWHLGNNWPFGDGSVFLSIETSRPVNGADFNNGPVVRVGDRLSVFDSEAVAVLMRTASEQGIRVQRCLLDKGACEATAAASAGPAQCRHLRAVGQLSQQPQTTARSRRSM